MQTYPSSEAGAPGAAQLSEPECRTLLATRTFGRVGLTSGGLPVILPVRYGFADGVITFSPGQDTALRAAQSGDVLAFEVDAFDPVMGEGWSVLALGRATVVTEELRPTVQLHCELLTGQLLSAERVGG